MRIARPIDPDYAAVVDRLCKRPIAAAPEVAERVRGIVADVRARGDEAVRELTQRFENRDPSPIELPRDQWRALAAQTRPEVRSALTHAAARIRAFHERQRPFPYEYEEAGVRLGLRVEPLARVAVYAPGGTARYPSSVLMTAVPARVAGCPEVLLCTPGPSPETLAAAELAGVDRVFQIGGAQAIAALAYGTASVPRVDKIVGPGNAYVAEAKRQVFGDVAIDAVAGPSEVLLLADGSATPALLAADLLAQAEHGQDSFAVLVTSSEAIAVAVARELDRQLADLPRRDIAAASLRDHGAIVLVDGLDEAVAFANAFAPEHVGLHLANAREVSARLRTSGAIFVGEHTPEAVGDYLAGPNHVLPTAGTARFASPLGVYDFIKHTSVLEYSAEALRAHGPDVVRLAEAEGLEAHGRSILARTKA